MLSCWLCVRVPLANMCLTSWQHRLIHSVMVAAKFFDDIYYDNAYYAKVCLCILCALWTLAVDVPVCLSGLICAFIRAATARWAAYRLQR